MVRRPRPALSALTLLALASGAACLVSEETAEVPLESTTASVIVVSARSSGDLRVEAIAIAPGTAFVTVPLDGVAAAYALEYTCDLPSLALAPGEVALGSGAALPRPSRTQRAAPSSVAVLPEAPLEVTGLRLAAPSVRPSCCPDTFRTSTISASLSPCASDACMAAFSKDLAHCSFTFDLSACEPVLGARYGAFSGRMRPDGSLDVPPPAAGSGLTCLPIAAEEYAANSFSCTTPAGCTLSVHKGPDEPAFIVESVPVLVVPRYVARSETNNRPPIAKERSLGYLSDLALVGSSEIVITSYGGEASVEPVACWLDRPTTLHFFDRASLRPLRTATAPPCLTRVLGGAPGGGFWGVFGAPVSRTSTSGVYETTIAELDPAGRILRRQSVRIEHPRRESHDLRFGPVELVRADGRLLLALASTAIGELPIPFSMNDFVLELDAQSLALTKPIEEGRLAIEVELGSLVIVPGGWAIADGTADVARWSDGLVEKIWDDIDAGHIAYHAPSRQLVVPSGDEHAGLYLLEKGQGRGRRAFFTESDVSPMIVVPWPADPALMLAAGTRASEGREAVIALIDPGRTGPPRIEPAVVPGSAVIGRGAVGRMVADGDRVLAILPYTAELVRISPRSSPAR